MKHVPYISIDLETTGLPDEGAQILQIAAVYDDGSEDVASMPTLNFYIRPEGLIKGNPFALALNHKILKAISNPKDSNIQVINESDARLVFDSWVKDVTKGERIEIAGKNAAIFDIPLLKTNGYNTKLFKHRVIDPGSMYRNKFGYIPSLDEINKLLDRKPVTHDGLEDCYDVIAAIRHYHKTYAY